MFLKKIWNKFLNKKRYKELQNLEEDKKQTLKFKEKFENEVLINEKLKIKKHLIYFILSCCGYNQYTSRYKRII